ncbi:MAG: 3(2), 5-bisphosphate nucleotidase [Cyanobacteriota bacterium erpe_2018_sw_21hr_WHONDRS-SW48-000092_B_bin.40]|jgi:fructose-1,6-bisphosphatase/inositol monophosphatase family enzyme|nr:3(2), 5-bisphosphate nucleotidase [Cyanobacteriota bacterium erpe_2018_sw_21hr_WHONDRS-SW48-000092_B_bin.40]
MSSTNYQKQGERAGTNADIAKEVARLQQVIISACRQEFPQQTSGHSDFDASNLQQKLKIHTKNYSELVTAVDINLSKIILAAAREALPQSYSEEELPIEPSTAKLLWQIDPLDGTDEFAQGLTHFCGVSAALLSKKDNGTYQAIAGIIYIPAKELLLSADLTKSTLVIQENGIDITNRVKENYRANKAEHSILRGYQRAIDSNPEVESYYQTLAQRLNLKAETIRCGGAAHGFAALVLGEINVLCFNYDYSKEWDVSAAQPIIEALGGFVCDLTGQEIRYSKSYNKSNKTQDQFNRQGFIASIVFSKEQILPENTAALLLRRLD